LVKTIAFSLKTFFNVVALLIKSLSQTVMTGVSRFFGFPVQSIVYPGSLLIKPLFKSITFDIKSMIQSSTLSIQPVIKPGSFSIQSIINPVTFHIQTMLDSITPVLSQHRGKRHKSG